MKAERPRIAKDPLYQLLRTDDIQGFNKRRAQGGACDLRGVDFRSLDLRGLDADGLDFTGSYFRDADLRGVDLRQAVVEGCSFYGAKISGTYFPAELAAEEIRLSVELGTRVRYRR
ncbi:MAG TPA: pentapeptide repeat-containing protein [Candidatus Krumholzibacteria bacterium]|nr:pentapeptide repeat-containing protein [Candidatus Krumholzibacteria bacterium]HPD72558.1 pentapeptide repeat-containing protein [Candidatus Krumholzibacteria bacterium]HRY40510.1 pentapeptide repeat-containing protein [Candidatus Krumholzibacteria bacterium]